MMRRALSRVSGGSPKRIAKSKPPSMRSTGRSVTSSRTSTRGCGVANSETSGVIVVRPKPSIAFTRNSPRGTERLARTASAICRMSATMRVA